MKKIQLLILNKFYFFFKQFYICYTSGQQFCNFCPNQVTLFRSVILRRQWFFKLVNCIRVTIDYYPNLRYHVNYFWNPWWEIGMSCWVVMALVLTLVVSVVLWSEEQCNWWDKRTCKNLALTLCIRIRINTEMFIDRTSALITEETWIKVVTHDGDQHVGTYKIPCPVVLFRLKMLWERKIRCQPILKWV